MIRSIALGVLTICACLFFTACIKNTDFDQAENIVLTPVIDLDLIYFNLRTSDFLDSINATPILTVRDTTQVKFLDDSTLLKNLERVEFYFKFTNSIPRDFQVDFQFLSEMNDTTYFAETPVDQGTLAIPVITEFIENVEGDAIGQLTQANKVVVSVTIPASSENLDGSLNLKSKATYFFGN
ncbi:hypothetical protein [Aequorivita capsosiphonis]|uniref:hypothetical protein n=1 Tax=Aequorivita capsosiphonis TaxID=487317 RepID=UPI0004799A22|nr:hypothetical protein [Aequorivita capsosiphonis]